MCRPTARVQQLRAHALDCCPHWPIPELELLAARAWCTPLGTWGIEGARSSLLVRRAQITEAMLAGMTPCIDPGELIVGKPNLRPLTPDEEEELNQWRRWGAPNCPQLGGQSSHMAIDFPRLLQSGIQGLRRQIQSYLEGLHLDRPTDTDKALFYQACLISLDAVLTCTDRYAAHAEALAECEPDPVRAEELREIGRICRKVPRGQADTFREAVQSVHFLNAVLCMTSPGLFQLGRPDRFLYPYYQRDLALRRLSRSEAQELWDCVCILLNESIPRGLSVGYMVGGRDGYGQDTSNELTEMMLESVRHVRLAYPAVGLCWHRGLSVSLRRMSVELLAEGLSHPAIFNDELITRGLQDMGLPPEEACEYIHSTCVEITPIGSSGVWVASPYINLLQQLHDVLGIGKPGMNPDFPTFASLLAAVREHLEEAVTRSVAEQNLLRSGRFYQGGQPLVSCFVHDCLTRGKDIDQGGARYDWIEPSFVGLSNLVDALVSIREWVYEKQDISILQLKEVLETNFGDCEGLRLRMLNRTPKYGNDQPQVDELAVTVTEWVKSVCKMQRAYPDSAVIPGFFCWIMHEQLGRVTTASADGRLSGFPLGDGSGPAQGRELHGPTAAILSTTVWDHQPMLGGVALNLKFSPSGNRDQFVTKLADLVSTYCYRGGFEVQVNVVDKATLRAAQANPDEYRDLVVRIGGYSDYFVGLSPEMQAEVMMRCEHSSNG